MFNPVPSYAALALSRLITQYQGKPNMQGLVTGFGNVVQPIEAVFTDLNTICDLPVAQGAQLDGIGSIVGVERPAGLSDAAYLILIYAQIKINTSQGQPEALIQTYQLLSGAPQVRLFEFFPGEALLESIYIPPDQATTTSLIETLDKVTPAGVRVDALVSYDPVVPFGYAGVMSPSAGYDVGKYAGIETAFYPFGYGVNNPNIKGYGSIIDPYIGGAYAS